MNDKSKKKPEIDESIRAQCGMSKIERVDKDPAGRFLVVYGIHKRQLAACCFRETNGTMTCVDKTSYDTARDREFFVRHWVASVASDWRVTRDIDSGFLPISTYLLARCAVFQPAMRRSKPRGGEGAKGDAGGWVCTTWGRARVAGRLTAAHAHLIAALLKAGKPTLLPTGEVDLVIDLHSLYALGVPRGGYLYEMIDQIYNADVQIEAPATASRGAVVGGGRLLTEKFEEQGRRDRRRDGKTLAADRKVLRIRLGRWFVRLWSVDLCLYERDDFVQALARMKSGPARLAAIFCRTQGGETNGGYSAAFLFKTLWGIQREPTRDELREFCRGLHRDAAALKDVGFRYEAGRLRKL